ncbi:hypothetical protein V1264_008152 [Littorina saxatilis]|uniref:Microtubule-associated protein n=1 Tax=Littorina saxatilis TaxID=31220 RepID=A0AAN9G2F4_9CAEN
MDGVTTNGLHGDEASNGAHDVIKPPASDPMSMSGLFSRDLDLQGDDGDSTTSTSNISHSDAFGGCGMTDSFIQQEDLPPLGDQDQREDALDGCGMTDSFMQMTNGGSVVSGTDNQDDPSTLSSASSSTAPTNTSDGVLIDFGLPAATTAPPTTTTDVGDNGMDSQAAMFGEDLEGSQEALHRGGFSDGGDDGAIITTTANTNPADDYHPGQPTMTTTTNPFATGEPLHPEPPAPHPAMPAGIDLLIQSAPPPPHPYPEEEGEKEKEGAGEGEGYNPFAPTGEERLESDDTTATTNPFAEPARMVEQAGGHAAELLGGLMGGGEQEGEGGWNAERVTGAVNQAFSEDTDPEMETASLPSFNDTTGITAAQEHVSALSEALDTGYLADLEMSAAPGAPRGSEETTPSPPSQLEDIEAYDRIETAAGAPGSDIHVGLGGTDVDFGITTHAQESAPATEEVPQPPATESSPLVPEIPAEVSPPEPEPEKPQPKEETSKPVLAVVPQPTPASTTQIPKSGKTKPGEKIPTKSPKKAAPPTSPTKSGVPVKTKTTPATRQRPASATTRTSFGSRPTSASTTGSRSTPGTTTGSRPTSASTTGSRPTSARAAKKDDGTPSKTSTPTSRPRTAPSTRLSKDSSQDKTATNGVKSDVSKPGGRSPATRTSAAKPSPNKAASTPRATTTPRSTTTPKTPTGTGSASPASSASGSAKTDVKSKIGSLNNATHTPGGGNVKIQSKKPDVSKVGSRIGSKDMIDHKPGGGNVKIETKKLEFGTVKSRVGSLDNAKHTPKGGEKKIESQKLDWKVSSRIGSLDNARHTPRGGDKKIESKKLDWKVQSKIGSLDNAKHTPGGGDKKIEQKKLDWKVESKIGSLDNAQHVAGGGDKKVITMATASSVQYSPYGCETKSNKCPYYS